MQLNQLDFVICLVLSSIETNFDLFLNLRLNHRKGVENACEFKNKVNKGRVKAIALRFVHSIDGRKYIIRKT